MINHTWFVIIACVGAVVAGYLFASWWKRR
jgi:hypothetical protein